MTTKNPFDFSEIFKQFDPAETTRQFQTMFDNSPFTSMQTGKFAETQQKNMEAFLQAQKAVIDGAQAIMQSQTEMMQKAMAEASETVNAMAAGSPGEIPEKNAEAVEKAFHQSVENLREISEMIENMYEDVSTRVEERVQENLVTLRENLSKAKDA